MKVRFLSIGILCLLASMFSQPMVSEALSQSPDAERSWIVCFNSEDPLPEEASREEVIRFLQARLQKNLKFGAGRIDVFACLERVLATVSLAESFVAYEEALHTERALIGIGPLSPLASSLLIRALPLDEGEFRALTAQVPANGAAAELLEEATRLRLAEKLQQ